MDIVELGRLTSVALTYQNYLQELNAENISLAPTNTKHVMDASFVDLLKGTRLDEEGVAEWTRKLEQHTRSVAADGSLDQISLDVQRATANFNKIAEAYGRALSIYSVALGRR